VRFGSLFSGIGGLDLGLERAGMDCAWQVEIDDYCRRVLAKHWPDVPKHTDIRAVDFERVERVDLVAGGFPCQDLSYAGKGAGLSGARSGLWSEFKRAIRLVGPRYVLVENVPGLLSRGMGVVCGDLAELGYVGEWESLPAAAFGAPHLRYRVFIVAHANEQRRKAVGHTDARYGTPLRTQAGEHLGMGRVSDVADANGTGREQRRWTEPVQTELAAAERGSEDVAHTNGDNEQRRSGTVQVGRLCLTGEVTGDGLTGGTEWAVEPDVGGGSHGPAARLDGGGIDGDAAQARPDEALPDVRGTHVTQEDQWAAGGQGGVFASSVLRQNLHGTGVCQRCAISQGRIPLEGAEDALRFLRVLWGDGESSRPPRRREAGEQLAREHPDVVRLLSFHPPPPCQACWSDGSWEDGLTRIASRVPNRTHRLRGLGNAVVPQVAEWIGERILQFDEAMT
jgi:DNA-cytosine methyltransferase